jgi:surface polysaccharide O-acyltransferase-like enzyme
MERNYKIELLRVIASFAVVIIHVLFIWSDVPNETVMPVVRLYSAASQFCVPVFIIISGMLILNHDYQYLFLFYRKRLLRLIPGFILFAIPYLLIRYFDKDESVFSIIRNGLLFGYPWIHFWYVYMLIVLYFFAPFIQHMVKNLPIRELLVLIVSLFILSWISDTYFYFAKKETIWLFSSLRYLGYFILGYAIDKIDIFRNFKRMNIILIITYAISTFVIYTTDYSFLKNYVSLPVLIQSLSVFYLIYHLQVKEKLFISKISKYTYGIYLLHPVFFYFVDIWMTKHRLDYTMNPIFWIPVFALFGYTITYYVVFLMNRIIRTG